MDSLRSPALESAWEETPRTQKEQYLAILEEMLSNAIDGVYSYDIWTLNEAISRIQSEVSDGWTPVSELPPNEKNVLGTYNNSMWKRRVVRCFYARKFEVEMSDDPYDFWEYSEEKDEYYLPEWWYESNENNEISYQISEEITHWMPLSLPPITL